MALGSTIYIKKLTIKAKCCSSEQYNMTSVHAHYLILQLLESPPFSQKMFKTDRFKPTKRHLLGARLLRTSEPVSLKLTLISILVKLIS
jgi:hypothetical protein